MTQEFAAKVTPDFNLGPIIMSKLKQQPFLIKMQNSEDKSTLMMWVSTSDHSELSGVSALTGMVNLFLEVCATVDADPFQVLETYFHENPDWKAGDFDME